MEITITQMQRHVLDLARHIDARFCPHHVGEDVNEHGACSDPRTRTVHMPPVTDSFTYAIALHELGHLAVPEANGKRGISNAYALTGKALRTERDRRIVLHEEMHAWNWARLNALCWNAEMERAVEIGVTSHAQPANLNDQSIAEARKEYGDAFVDLMLAPRDDDELEEAA